MLMPATINGRISENYSTRLRNLEVYENPDTPDLTEKEFYYEINLPGHWVSNNTWENFTKHNRLHIVELKREQPASFADLRNFKNEVKPTFGKFKDWSASEGDFYVSEELPDNSQKLKSKINKLKKIKYQLSAFLLGTIIVLTLVSSLIARF